jgi:hypothetical protein
MTISVAKAPTNGPALIAKHLNQLDIDLRGSPSGGDASSASRPMRLFTVKLGDISSVDFIAKAFPIGWRYFVFSEGETAIADLLEKSAGEDLNFGGLTTGVLPDRLSAAAQVADQLYEARGAIFEARILELPALYTVTIWLHGETDVFIPALDGSETGSVIAPDDNFLVKMVHLAKDRRYLSGTE